MPEIDTNIIHKPIPVQPDLRASVINQLRTNIQSTLDYLNEIINFTKKEEHELEGQQLRLFLISFSNNDFTNNDRLNLLASNIHEIKTFAEKIYNTTMWSAAVIDLKGHSKWQQFNGYTRSAILQQCTLQQSPLLSTTTFYADIYKPKSLTELRLFSLKENSQSLYITAMDHIANLTALNLNYSINHTYHHSFV